jgi:hypothetical protein
MSTESVSFYEMTHNGQAICSRSIQGQMAALPCLIVRGTRRAHASEDLLLTLMLAL